MKILHIIPSYYPAFKYGGPVQSAFHLNKMLIKKNIELDVVTTNAGIENKVKTGEWYNYEGVRVKYFKYFGYEHYNFSPSLYKELKELIKNYDLVHITAVWNFPVLVGSLLAAKNNIPYIISPKGALLKEAFNIKSGRIKKLYFNLFSKKNIINASALDFTTLYEQENFKSFTGIDKYSFVIPNGLDLNEIKVDFISFYSAYPSLINKKYILFLGRLNKIKGLDILINAFKKLSTEDESLYLVLAGPDNDNYMKEIKKLIDSNLTQRIIFTGSINEKHKWTAYAGAECFVLPSYSENFGLAAIEAMACGTPVIISNKVGILKEIEEAGAGLVVDVSADSLYHGIKNLINNDLLKKKYSENGKKLVNEKYDIDRVAGQMINQYRKIIDGDYA